MARGRVGINSAMKLAAIQSYKIYAVELGWTGSEELNVRHGIIWMFRRSTGSEY